MIFIIIITLFLLMHFVTTILFHITIFTINIYGDDILRILKILKIEPVKFSLKIQIFNIFSSYFI